MSVVHAVNRAMDHHRNGRLVQAETEYRNVLARDPNNADSLHLLGTILAGKGDVQEGVDLIERALERTPNLPEAHLNLANILATSNRFADAAPHFRAAYRLVPTNAEAANGIGGSALRTGDHKEAEVWLKKALTLDPRCVNALLNMGMLMDAVGRFDETLAYYDRALSLAPHHAAAHEFKSLALLVRGRLNEGWKEYAWRFKIRPTFRGRFPFPYWRGEPLGGRRILVWLEQGLGDQVLVAGMIPDLLDMGAEVTLLCAPRLCELFARSFPAAQVLPLSATSTYEAIPKDVAFQASMSELGAQLRSSPESFPSPRSYLSADAELRKELRERYLSGAGENLLVGISWRSKAPDSGSEKTIALADWLPILKVPGVTFVNLQYGDTASEVSAVERSLGVQIIGDPSIDPLADMAPFAAQVAAMDFTVSVSNTTAHIAGALGGDAAVLIPSNSGRLWYWFLEGTRSSWYPHTHLYRQAKSDWNETMRQVAGSLASRRPAVRS